MQFNVNFDQINSIDKSLESFQQYAIDSFWPNQFDRQESHLRVSTRCNQSTRRKLDELFWFCMQTCQSNWFGQNKLCTYADSHLHLEMDVIRRLCLKNFWFSRARTEVSFKKSWQLDWLYTLFLYKHHPYKHYEPQIWPMFLKMYVPMDSFIDYTVFL